MKGENLLGTLLDCAGDRNAACCFSCRIKEFEILSHRKQEFSRGI